MCVRRFLKSDYDYFLLLFLFFYCFHSVFLRSTLQNHPPQNFSVLSLDNCSARNEHHHSFCSLFFLSVCVWVFLFLFGRFMACLRAIYINTWYMKIKLCNKICRWSTVWHFGSCFRCSICRWCHLAAYSLIHSIFRLRIVSIGMLFIASNCWYQRFSYLFHFI